MARPLHVGEPATLSLRGRTRTVVILRHVDSATGEQVRTDLDETPVGVQLSLCRAVLDGWPVGPEFLTATEGLRRTFLPVPQARRMYIAVNNLARYVELLPVMVPATPIGTREYAEYGAQLSEELARYVLCAACGGHVRNCEHPHDRIAREILTRHADGDHSLCVAIKCGPRPSLATLMETY